MKANENYIYRFLDGTDKKFIIPVYQRPYSWKKQNCELLFSDLMSVYEKNYTSHFFGSIVYVANEVAGCNEYIIIDGQQRITTVSLLLLAIRNYIVANKIEADINPRKITNAYLTDEYANDEKKLKLKLVQGDDQAYDKLMEGGTPVANNSVTVNYNYFYDELENLTPDKIKGIYEAIMKLMIVNISLTPSNGDDPQLIFESLNSTGLDLDEADKIRNYVLMNMSAAQQEKFYRKYWETLEKKVSRNDINKFIRYYLAALTGELANEKKLYFAFKNYKQLNDIEIETLIQDMLEYAEFYSIIKNSKLNAKNYESVLARLNRLDVNSCTPLLFHLFKAHKNDELDSAELEKAFSIIENYIVRRIVCGLATNQLNKVFVALGAEIQKYIDRDEISYYDAFVYAVLNKTGKSRFPNNHDLSDKFMSFELYNARPSIRKYFFERFENHGTKEKIAVEEQIDDGTLTIEHIMPQTLNDEWKAELGDNWELIHSKYKDTIGNLTLTAYNSDYSNLPFIKKKEMPDKGFMHSKLALNKSLQCCTEWGEQHIIDRANELYEFAEVIWWIPSTAYNPQAAEQWITWDDEFDFTNMLVTKMRFMGDEINTSNISDVYKKINSLLYDLDTPTYFSMDPPVHNSSSTVFRTPVEVVKDIYIETNMSSPAKMNAVSKLAEHFNLDSQDIQVLIRSKEKKPLFDIKNEDTYSSVTVGQLAYSLIGELLSAKKLTDEEIELLKTKEYSKKVIPAIVYPILAECRDANRGNSKKLRYRKTPVNIDGKEIFISCEWFDDFRETLVNWYKKHI